MKRGALLYSLTAVLMTLFMVNSTVFADSYSANQDAKAIEVLKQMDSYTNSLEKFVIKAESYLDASIGEGLIISNAYDTKVSVVRTQSLHSISKSGSQTNEIYLHKGALTVYTGEQKFFTHAKVPEPLDNGLIFALEELDVETPLLDLLVLHSLDKLITPGVEVVYVTGDSTIRGVDCHHILMTGPQVDMQIWIEKGDRPLPRKTLMTYRYGEGMPRHEVFLEWTAVDGFDKSEFEFIPPKGAVEIDFVQAP